MSAYMSLVVVTLESMNHNYGNWDLIQGLKGEIPIYLRRGGEI